MTARTLERAHGLAGRRYRRALAEVAKVAHHVVSLRRHQMDIGTALDELESADRAVDRELLRWTRIGVAMSAAWERENLSHRAMSLFDATSAG